MATIPSCVVTTGASQCPQASRRRSTKLPEMTLPLRFLAERVHQPLHRALRHVHEVRRPPESFAHGGDEVGNADRLCIRGKEGLASRLLRGEHERDRGDSDFQARAASGGCRARQRAAASAVLGEGRERGNIAFDAASVDNGGAEHGEGDAASPR